MTTTPHIIIVTNTRNQDAAAEDSALATALSCSFATQIVDVKDASRLDPRAPILLRNAWPDIEHVDELALIARRSVYSHAHRGLMAEKTYLRELFETGMQVIPTAILPMHLRELPPCSDFIVKPINGGSSRGVTVVPAASFDPARLDGRLLVQPALQLRHELSFFFVDDVFSYAMCTGTSRWHMVPHEPSKEEMMLALEFVAWNKLAHGLQRVDLCRTQAGELFLMELEEHMAYLSWDDMCSAQREQFVSDLQTSLARWVKEVVS